MKMRPRLLSFRVEAFHSENRAQGRAGVPWTLQIQQEIEVGFGMPAAVGGALQALVRIVLSAKAHATDGGEAGDQHEAVFKGEYAGQFVYPTDAAETEVQSSLGEEEHQYLLVAQVFPLAMMHFRRELMATGFDSRELPIGFATLQADANG
jgi:hypothetical protein